MKAMIFEKVGEPLKLMELPQPQPQANELLIQVEACAVCRTDLHIVDGELAQPKLPLILGHQIVGIVVQVGEGTSRHSVGERVGVPWLAKTCQECEFCLSGRENLCNNPLFTGYTRDGGYAEFCTAHEDYVFSLPLELDPAEIAPYLCAGLIGYRAFKSAAPNKKIGFYGLGSSAHLLIQLATQMGYDVYVFTRPGDEAKQQFGTLLGAVWTGGSDQQPPELLDAAIIFAPVGELYPQALKAIKKGGRVISAGIHMSDVPSFPYSLLWEERAISSVANLTRQDGIEFLDLVKQYPLKTSVTSYPLSEANAALQAIREGSLDGSAVLLPK